MEVKAGKRRKKYGLETMERLHWVRMAAPTMGRPKENSCMIRNKENWRLGKAG